MYTLLVSVLAGLLMAPTAGDPETARIAVFNIWELSFAKLDVVDAEGRGAHPQLRGAAEIVQRVRPDILLINEIDFDPERSAAKRFVDRYLKVSQHGQKPIDYPFVFAAPVNTGLPSGLDLNNDGQVGGADDAWGFGRYPGQYGMALLSRYPLDAEHVRTFQTLAWRRMPNNRMPNGEGDKPAWYSPEEAAVLRLSSKSHWDVPVRIGDTTLHLLCAHPTPPVFDGPEDRNGRRNFDEIRLWADYLTGGDHAAYIVDDAGRQGPLPADAKVVILGDLNADPVKGEATYGEPAIRQLLDHARLRDPGPTSAGAAGKNRTGPPEYRERKTCDFGRLDYVLPSRDLKVVDCGVFWPAADDPLHRLVTGREDSSDHRLVWVDVERQGLRD